MLKKVCLSLFTIGIIIPFFVVTVLAYPPNKGEHRKEGKSVSNERSSHPFTEDEIRSVHKKMQDPQFMKMVQPMRDIGLDLFSALEKGDIKAGQKSSKELAQSILELNDADVKKRLANVVHIATVMSTATTYKEMQTGYSLIRKEAEIFHAGRETRERPPRLIVDVTTFGTIHQAQSQVKQLLTSLPKDNSDALNVQIDTVMKTLKNIKTPQLQDYITSLASSLTEMKRAKTVLEKAAYTHIVSNKTHELAMVTRNQ